MTCIVGYVYDNKVFIGADSAGVAGLSIRSRSDDKVFIKDDMVYGFTSSFRMGQVLRYCFSRPLHEDGIDDYQYMCSTYITELIKCFSEHGYLKKDGEQVSGGTFLVGYKGKLYRIEDDFQVGMNYDNYDACGCGEDYAMGALNILEQLDCDGEDDAKNLVLEALKTAEKFSAGVSSPFKVRVI